MRNKRLAAALGAAILLTGGTVNALTFDEIVEKGELTVAVYGDFPPFSSQQGGQLTGVDVDVAKELAARLKLRPVVMDFKAGESVDDDLRNMVWKGHYIQHVTADVMLHVPADRIFARRNPNVVIFGTYYQERIVLARNPEKVFASDGLDVFTHENVGVEGQTLSDVYLTSAMGGQLVSHVVHFMSVDKAVQALKDGQVAAVMGPQSEVSASLADQSDHFPLGPVTTPGLTKPSWELGMAVKDSNHQLADALDEAVTAMRKDGTIAAIFARHGLSYVAPDQ